MGLYKLRHFAVFLFQTLNEHVEGLRVVAASGTTVFAPSLNVIVHSEGVRLIMRAADKLYFQERHGFSQGMYLSMLK